MKLTKRKVKELLDIKTDVALSAHFKLSRAAANLWKDDEEIPAEHQMTLLRERPALAFEVLRPSENKAA